jgi:hypothetical protein
MLLALAWLPTPYTCLEKQSKKAMWAKQSKEEINFETEKVLV